MSQAVFVFFKEDDATRQSPYKEDDAKKPKKAATGCAPRFETDMPYLPGPRGPLVEKGKKHLIPHHNRAEERGCVQGEPSGFPLRYRRGGNLPPVFNPSQSDTEPLHSYLLLLTSQSKRPRRNRRGLALCWRLPIFPGRYQPSIVSASELNCRVRDGNGCTLTAISTNFVRIIP